MKELTISDEPIKACVSCDRFFISGRWSNDLERLVSTIVSQNVSIRSIDPPDAFEGRAPRRVTFELEFDEHLVSIDIPVENTQCPDCVKKHSHYFEGYLQLRGGSRAQYDAARTILESHRGYVKEERALKDGIDLKVSSNRAIIATLKDLNKRFIGSAHTSASLHTRDHQSSKEKHRVTGRFRFSKLRKGNVFVENDTLFILEKTKGSLCELLSLRDGRTTITVALEELETHARIEAFETRIITTRPRLTILSETYGDVEALNRSSRELEDGMIVRAVGMNGLYAVID
jgi:NMD protein affecting ribosome stability and mRNA decay